MYVLNEKKRSFANLIKVSYLFSYDIKDEAENIFNETQKLKLSFMCKALTDAILKSDRAMVMGDYKTAELYYLTMLEQAFPKLDNLGKLIAHYKLGEVYEKLQDNEKAVFYYKYCANHGGETAIRLSAKSAIERIQELK